MSRKEITEFLSNLLIQNKFSGIGKYYASEVTLDYGKGKGNGRVYLRYGNGEENIDLCDYISREAANKNCKPTPQEVMDGACIECDCPLAILYYVATQAAELRARLKEYEDHAERKTPKKPILSNEELTRNDTCYCPCCGRSYVDYYDNYDSFCSDCGQALDWSEFE